MLLYVESKELDLVESSDQDWGGGLLGSLWSRFPSDRRKFRVGLYN